MSGPRDEECVIEEWFSSTRLTVAASTKIRAGQIEDLDTLLLMTDSDVETLRLALGDSLRLRAGLAALKVKYIYLSVCHF